MTTTLRPTEPLQRAADGTLSRHYEVCVNSRVVGALRLATDSAFGAGVARVGDLRIAEADRGRGRGAIAALAAEEVARDWGCRSIEASVPADSEPARGLAAALGYVERGRTMEKPLADERPALPAGSTVRPLADTEFGAWAGRLREEYAQSWIQRGVPEAAARTKSEHDHARYLPDGAATDGMLLRVLEHAGAPVGTLWLALREADSFVLNVEVGEEHRGRGHGRALMLVAEAEAIRAGRDRIGLHVFAGNAPALGLYASLGYRPTQYHLHKPLT